MNAATPQTDQSSVAVGYTGAQIAGDTNIVAIGWNNATSKITSVTDSAGNTYQLAVPTARGAGLSQAIYYAPNIKAAAAGTNTVTVNFNTATRYVDVRATEYSGLDPVNPFDVGTSASGTGTTANSGTVTTTTANALIFGAGITTGGFSTAGTNYATRIITTPDRDIAEDRIVTTTGAYSATAPLSGSAAWVMQVATFRAASTTTAAAPPYPASVSGRKILDQNGDVYLMRTFSSWGMAQQLAPAEITAALEAVAANGFNAVTVWIGGGFNLDSRRSRYTNANGDGFWTGTPWASGLGEGWSSVDSIVQETARLGLTANLSFCGGCGADWESVTDADMYDAGVAIATRYLAYPNIVWHVMFDNSTRPVIDAGPADRRALPRHRRHRRAIDPAALGGADKREQHLRPVPERRSALLLLQPDAQRLVQLRQQLDRDRRGVVCRGRHGDR